MANSKSELRNPIFWSAIAFVLGIGLGIWGLIKEDCIGPNCWVGSGFLLWSGGILIVGGAIGFFTLGKGKR